MIKQSVLAAIAIFLGLSACSPETKEAAETPVRFRTNIVNEGRHWSLCLDCLEKAPTPKTRAAVSRVSRDTALRTQVHFKRGSVELDAEAQAMLVVFNTRVRQLAHNRPLRLRLFGLTDQSGSTERNALVAQQRAETVERYLRESGLAIQSSTISTDPACCQRSNEDSDEGRTFNRRVEIEASFGAHHDP